MARKPKKSSSLVQDLEDQAFNAGKAKLDDLLKQLVDDESDIKERLYQLMEDHKALCQEKAEQRSRIILETLATNTKAGRFLENDENYRILIPKKTVWVHKGAVIQFVPSEDKPAADHSDALSLPTTDDKKRTMPMALIPPDSESGKNTDLNDYPSPPIFEQDRPEYHRKPSSRHSSTRSSAFNLRPKQRVQEYFSNRDWAIQRPIPMGQTDNYWIFDYPFMEGRFLFILRCPATKCQHPVFSLHPLKQDRAVKHLKACGQRFDDEEDIVKRYARQVISGRKGRIVTQTWVRKHNLKLLGANEKHLEGESL